MMPMTSRTMRGNLGTVSLVAAASRPATLYGLDDGKVLMIPRNRRHGR